MGENTEEAEITRAIREARTQYNTQKNANQQVVWSIDPSRPLNRQRTLWRSNGSLFDSTLFVNGEGETEINLTATGSDSARLKSAFVGQYISHALSEPGLGISIDGANVQLDADNEISLDHGLVQFGPFFHDGGDITDGFGFELDSTGMRFRAVLNSTDVGDSPIPQSKWNVNRVNADDKNLDLSLQQVFNFPYGFYNALPLTAARILPRVDEKDRRARQELLHSEETGNQPLLRKPNLPMQVFASNEGTASTLNVNVGGIQYARYGAGDPRFRVTNDFRSTTGGTFTATETGEPDPANEPGDAFFAYRRKPDEEDLTIRDRQVTIDPTADIFIYMWDEWEPSTALDGTFGEPAGGATTGGTNTSTDETLVETQTDCTTYTPTVANYRGQRRADAGQNNTIDPTSEEINDRTPQEATRVWTLAIRDGSNSVDIDFLEAEWEEAY